MNKQNSIVSKFSLAFVVSSAVLIGGCSSSPQLTQSGFISDYSKLKAVDDHRMRYVDEKVYSYKYFMIDPVTVQIPITEQSILTDQDRAEVASYFRERMIAVLTEGGYQLTDKQGPQTARIKIALTDVAKSTWWMKIHPATNLTGAGRGGAAMETEVVDSVSGKQLAATIAAAKGSQFTMMNLSTKSDVMSAIDQWAKYAAEKMKEVTQKRNG